MFSIYKNYMHKSCKNYAYSDLHSEKYYAYSNFGALKNMHKLRKNYARPNFRINDTKTIHFLYKFSAFILQKFYTLFAAFRVIATVQ